MAKKLTEKEVEHVAKLARIEITDKEKKQYSEELSKVLEYIEKIQEVETDDVEPTFQPSRIKDLDVLENATREDKVVKCKDREKLLDAGPDREGDFFKVKAVLK